MKKLFYTTLLSSILIVTAVLPSMAYSVYDKLLFYPIKELDEAPEKLNNILKEDVFISSVKGKKLHAWFFQVNESSKVVLISHGNAGNISHRIFLIDLFLKQGLSVLAYDYQGYGKSEGKPTINNVCADGLAAFDYLVDNKGYKAEQIILYGESLGGGITCSIASKREPGALILQSTFSSLPSVAKKVMKVFKAVPSFLYPRNKMDNTLVVSEKHAPLLIIHGTEDEIIPFSEAQRLNSEAIEPKTFTPIKGAGHNNIYPAFAKSLSDSIANFIKTYKID